VQKRVLIQGHQVKLRSYIEADYPLLRHWMKGEQAWKKLDAPYYIKPTDVEADAIVDKQIETDKLGAEPPAYLAIAHATDDYFIGEVTRYWICKRTRWPALGIIIYDPSYWGKGYATGALSLWQEYLWDAMPDSWRMDIETWSGNEGMMRVASKLGYKLEGRFTDARKVDGRYYDGLRYGKLRSDRHTI
jgi:RimJ/RimL family protein N-acetyltransferase